MNRMTENVNNIELKYIIKNTNIDIYWNNLHFYTLKTSIIALIILIIA